MTIPGTTALASTSVPKANGRVRGSFLRVEVRVRASSPGGVARRGPPLRTPAHSDGACLTMSIEISTAGIVPRFSSQCRVCRSLASQPRTIIRHGSVAMIGDRALQE